MKQLQAVAALLMLLVACSPAFAALTDWYSGNVTEVVDPDEGFLPGQEILNAWHKYDADLQTHFFRMQVEEKPMGPAGVPPGFAGIYGIALNVDPATGVDGSTPGLAYAPNVGGIDYLLDAHYDYASTEPLPPTFQKADYHDWEPPSFLQQDLYAVGGDFEKSGTIFEWAIPDSLIGSPGDQLYGWCAYTLDGGSETAKYDVACSVIPEPITMTGLGLGLAGLAGYMRRRKSA